MLVARVDGIPSSWQQWDKAIAKATREVRFFLNVYLGIGFWTLLYAGGEANTCSVVHKPHTQSFAGPPVTKLICPVTYLANITTILGNFLFDFRSRTRYLYLTVWLSIILCSAAHPLLCKINRIYIGKWWCHWGLFPWFLPTKPCALRSTQPLKMNTRDFSWRKGDRCVWLTACHPCSAERRDDPES
jgi:hypothetical protein